MNQLSTPYEELLLPLSSAEFEALKADVERHGVLNPITIDEDGNILDGHHRYKIVPDAPTVPVTGLTEAEKKAFVYRSNLARRNLSADQKKAMLPKLKELATELKAEGRTQEDIAALMGVDQSTISRWFTNSMNGHNTSKPGAVKDETLDNRVKVPKKKHRDIAERLGYGDTQEQVAADFGLSQQRIAQIAKKERKRQEKKKAKEDAGSSGEVADRSWDVRPGQLWALGDHLLMCGNAYDQEHVGRLVAGREVSALITDPPYGIGYQPDWEKWDGSASDFDPVTGDEEPFDPSPFLYYPTTVFFGANNFSSKLPEGGWICWDKRLDEKKDAMFGSPFELAWFQSDTTERRAIMIRVLHGGVVNADSKKGNNEPRYVPTQKPVKVMSAILVGLTHEGDWILDPFAGSGSTLLACEKMRRKCMAMEIEPAVAGIVLQRWYENTGEEPCLASRE